MNPVGGQGKAVHTYRSQPLLTKVEAECDVITGNNNQQIDIVYYYTEYVGHGHHW